MLSLNEADAMSHGQRELEGLLLSQCIMQHNVLTVYNYIRDATGSQIHT